MVDAEALDGRNWADRITVGRMAAAPLLFAAGAFGASRLFLGLAVLGLLSDVADGLVARALGQASARGARLDSHADLAFYAAFLAGLAFLIPERLLAEWRLVTVVATAYAVPILVGWARFGRLTSYHTVLARVSLGALAAGVACWLAFDLTLPLRLGTVVLAISAVEELALTLLLDTPRDNIPHLFHSSLHSTGALDPCRPERSTPPGRRRSRR